MQSTWLRLISIHLPAADMNNRLLFPAVILVVLLLVVVVLLFWPVADKQVAESKKPPVNFVLQTAQGPLELAQLRGKIVLLYFGYTNCPDVCPTSLALLGFALHKLEPGEQEKIQPVFISVDPNRDKVENLAEYVAYFHPSMLGATGTEDQIASVARTFGVIYSYEQDDSDEDYVVNHSSMTYLLDRDGRLYETIPHGASPDKIVATIRRALVH